MVGCFPLILGYVFSPFGVSSKKIKSGRHNQNYVQKKEIVEIDKTPKAQISFVSSLLIDKIENYQREISPRLHDQMGSNDVCRFDFSCSDYAKHAIAFYGPIIGGLKAAYRLIKCNPVKKRELEFVSPILNT
ncbi:membrane protein insertion efficiency factor YidD [Candidatus Woesearchaeota archaeon]|jgi:uncharacterized protein|nr:membrane protein insertion efficiency factor YidD [Candidatus Woesearchaeota archaeon]